ncbi:hypothetical protein BHM03_00054282 [Ensete ventricosum]|nr:hypothetical protein BHM03_00054282 [Ensete ventricosum]
MTAFSSSKKLAAYAYHVCLHFCKSVASATLLCNSATVVLSQFTKVDNFLDLIRYNTSGNQRSECCNFNYRCSRRPSVPIGPELLDPTVKPLSDLLCSAPLIASAALLDDCCLCAHDLFWTLHLSLRVQSRELVGPSEGLELTTAASVEIPKLSCG